MVNTIKLNLDIDKIREKLEIGRNTTISLPEIVCHKLLETNISRWIAYLLDPQKNRYALQFLNILLRKASKPECKSDKYEVQKERFLDVDSIIDVYITTQEYIIGIEVKIGASETGGDQTERYHNEILKRCQKENKDPVEIYLKPSSNTNKHKCLNFIDVTFKDILPELHNLSEHLPMNREHFILDEFINYLEHGPERARFLSLLSKEEEKNLRAYHKDLYKEMTQYIADNSELIKIITNQKEIYPADGLGFMQLKRKGADWEKIHFHYEILWTESHYLALNRKVVVAVHLLEKSSRFSKERKKEITELFNSDLPDGQTLFSREIEVDFTSIDKARKSLDNILAVLDCKEVVHFGNIADEYINSN